MFYQRLQWNSAMFHKVNIYHSDILTLAAVYTLGSELDGSVRAIVDHRRQLRQDLGESSELSYSVSQRAARKRMFTGTTLF